ncbi:MAG TPA: AAA family ATPase, partial [Candidatus Saccharimonadales bacterium]
LSSVELGEYQKRLVASLSDGQRARVSLAIALLKSPKVLLLDEPTVGLDPVLRQKLWAMFAELSRAGITLLISSHIMDEADKCDNLLFVRDGKLLISDTKEAVLSKSKALSMEDAFLKLANGVAL